MTIPLVNYRYIDNITTIDTDSVISDNIIERLHPKSQLRNKDNPVRIIIESTIFNYLDAWLVTDLSDERNLVTAKGIYLDRLAKLKDYYRIVLPYFHETDDEFRERVLNDYNINFSIGSINKVYDFIYYNYPFINLSEDPNTIEVPKLWDYNDYFELELYQRNEFSEIGYKPLTKNNPILILKNIPSDQLTDDDKYEIPLTTFNKGLSDTNIHENVFNIKNFIYNKAYCRIEPVILGHFYDDDDENPIEYLQIKEYSQESIIPEVNPDLDYTDVHPVMINFTGIVSNLKIDVVDVVSHDLIEDNFIININNLNPTGDYDNYNDHNQIITVNIVNGTGYVDLTDFVQKYEVEGGKIHPWINITFTLYYKPYLMINTKYSYYNKKGRINIIDLENEFYDKNSSTDFNNGIMNFFNLSFFKIRNHNNIKDDNVYHWKIILLDTNIENQLYKYTHPFLIFNVNNKIYDRLNNELLNTSLFNYPTPNGNINLRSLNRINSGYGKLDDGKY